MAKDYEFKVDNHNFRDVNKKIISNLPKFHVYILEELAKRLIRKVKKKTPVDTGHLKKNWEAKKPVVNKNEAYVKVENNVEYAEAVELGHRTKTGGFIEGRFMLKRSIDELEKQIPGIYYREMQKFIDKNGGGKKMKRFIRRNRR